MWRRSSAMWTWVGTWRERARTSIITSMGANTGMNTGPRPEAGREPVAIGGGRDRDRADLLGAQPVCGAQAAVVRGPGDQSRRDRGDRADGGGRGGVGAVFR